MELLRELMRLQHEHGWLENGMLRELAARRRVPLYRLEGLVSFYPHFRRTPPARVSVRVCRDVACAMAGGAEFMCRLREALPETGDVELDEVSCLGRCDAAPAVAVNDAPARLAAGHELAALLERIADVDSPPTGTDLPAGRSGGAARRWRCDPYREGGEPYQTVRSLVTAGAGVGEVCIERLTASQLRGMGGAGFPTGRKWELVAHEQARPKYVICNADESEPGTFKDRVILEELPHLVIEGMLLAGLAVGAEQGIVYLRHEYAGAQQSLEAALAQARHEGVLGADAAGSGHPFDVDVFVSPGGYILGEETALLEALEDKRGEPRNKPPYPGTHGLWGRPTLINNVETFALATSIVHHGPDWWRRQGTRGCAGLKFVSVSGDVERPGVYEIPMGTTVAELIALAGGMRDGRPLQAFLPGGASTRFLRAEQAETRLDFDAMKEAGSALGTGAVLVMAEGRDLFALAANLVRFFRNESCGKCVPCRVGSEKAVALLEGIRAGDASTAELAILPDLGATLEQTSICGLGQVALTPILSMLERFPEGVQRLYRRSGIRENSAAESSD